MESMQERPLQIRRIWQAERCLEPTAARFDEFPVLIKFIDAKDNLSIQVHPDNAYALKNEHQYRKN